MWALWREWPSFESRKPDALPGNPLSLSHTSGQAGGSYAVCSPHGSLSGCYEWMPQRCQTPGSAADAVPPTRLVLVAWHGHTDAEGN